MTKPQFTETTAQAWHNVLTQLRTSVAINPANRAANAKRAALPVREGAGIAIDTSRTPLNNLALEAFANYARAIDLQTSVEAMFAGKAINFTEERPALHTELRNIFSDSNNRYQQLARNAFDQMLDITTNIRSDTWLSGNTVTDIVNIGIGGSDLGPRMVSAALGASEQNTNKPKAAKRCSVHYVANVDPAELGETLGQCPAESTIFIIASKSFNTLETLENANTAKGWLLANGVASTELEQHFIAVTANRSAASEFGIAEHCILPLWDWVGGRFSLWSAIGLSIAIDIGPDQFTQLLQGAHAMDQHFRHSELDNNLPFILACLEVIYVNVMGAQSVAVLPYSHRLRLLPDYLQQLCMESNGKRVTNAHLTTDYSTCPVVWGGAGTVGQHSFHQLLHQGTPLIPVDFILPLHVDAAASDAQQSRQHAHLVANCLAQSKALIEGSSESAEMEQLVLRGIDKDKAANLAKHKMSPGNRPNTIISMDKLDAATLGALLAMYEHKVFILSLFWQINAFDQWGVELGKKLSSPIYAALTQTGQNKTDETTQYWIDRFKSVNSID